MVSSGDEQLTSRSALVSCEETPIITKQLEDVLASAEESAEEIVNLHVEINALDAEYQWQYGTNVMTWKNCTSSGFNTDTLSVLIKAIMDQRRYRFRIAVQGEGTAPR